MNKIHTLLQHPRLPVIAICLAVVLTLPTLWNGLSFDDNFHRLVLQGNTTIVPSCSSPLNLFCFSNGDADENQRLINIGSRPWWSRNETKLCFFRPLSSISHWLDYLFWPANLALMHAQSLVWFGTLVALVAFLYRRIIGVNWVAGLAVLFFAFDDAHSLIGSICNRNAVIACTFGVLCLITHDRWRRESWGTGALLSPFLLLLSLFSAEAGIATVAYLISYSLFLEKGSLRLRIISLIPYGFVLFLWGGIYVMLDYGATNVIGYTYPLKEPFLYLSAVFYRAPVYLLGQWALPPVFCNFFWPSFMHKAGLVFTMILLLILAPLIRKDRIARFWALGMILSVLPISSVIPHDRNLIFVGLGTMPLIAQWISWVNQTGWSRKLPLWRFSSRFLIIVFIVIHAVIAPLTLPISIRVPAKIQDSIVRASESLPFDLELKNQEFVIVNPPNWLFLGCYISQHRTLQGKLNPIKSLTSGGSIMTLKRVDTHTVTIRAESENLIHSGDTIFRSKKFDMHPGQKVELDDMIVEVLEVKDGVASAARYQFAFPLEDPKLAWFRWHNGIYVPFTLPEIGEEVTIEEAPFILG